MKQNTEVSVLARHIAARISADRQSLTAQWLHPQGEPLSRVRTA